MKNITTIIDKINADPSVMEIGKEGLALINQLLDIAEADVEADDCSQALEVIERIIRANQSEKTIIQMLSLRLTGVGLSAYSAKEYRVAEIAFKLLAEADDLIGKNNYAYMIRRHETSDAFEEDHVKVIQLLQEGVQQGDAFSLVNAALVFGLMMGGDKGWQVADSTFARLSITDGKIVSSWWEKLARQGDCEGYLVLFFLLKHNIINHSDLGSTREIAKILSKCIDGLPEWLIHNYVLETIGEIIKLKDEPDFDLILEEFLDSMPCSRKTVDELIKVISKYDLWLVYYKLLHDCGSLLSPTEREKIESDYKKKKLQAPPMTDKVLLLSDEPIHPFFKECQAQSGVHQKREANTTFKRYDVITFDKNDKVIVLAALVHEGNEYVYVNEVLPDESDVTDVYKIMIVHYEDGTLEKVVDPELLQVLTPKFRVILAQ